MVQDRHTVVFYTSAVCNLNCRYCAIDKNPALVEIDRKLEESFQGDYYFDYDNYVIYYFDGEHFVEIINLTENNQPTVQCEVTFNPNGGSFVSSTTGKIIVNKGETIDVSRIPVCYKEGFTFEGYYTTPEGPENLFSGKLDDLTIVAVWCHKADDNIFHYIGQLWKYLLLNEPFINSNTLFMGDFNASKIWDNECGWWSFSTVNKIFNQKKLYSYYHAARNEAFGEEKEHTYYHQWNKNKPFHIDYMYGSLERLKENSFRILSPEFELKLSDHAPLFCEIKT